MLKRKCWFATALVNLFIIGFAGNASAFANEFQGRAQLKFVNIDKNSETAMVYVTVFQEQAEWDNERGVTLGAILGAKREVSVENLRSQSYGFSAFIDVNGNGKLDTNVFGAPREPWALSKIGSKMPLGKPAWSSIAVEIKEDKTLEVPLYFHY
ncbi:MAG: hypothetical protein RJB66_196 [Pseudomonadota bacterium]|jgi:uncharacterized protein (DUF2141 family)